MGVGTSAIYCWRYLGVHTNQFYTWAPVALPPQALDAGGNLLESFQFNNETVVQCSQGGMVRRGSRGNSENPYLPGINPSPWESASG